MSCIFPVSRHEQFKASKYSILRETPQFTRATRAPCSGNNSPIHFAAEVSRGDGGSVNYKERPITQRAERQ